MNNYKTAATPQSISWFTRPFSREEFQLETVASEFFNFSDSTLAKGAKIEINYTDFMYTLTQRAKESAHPVHFYYDTIEEIAYRPAQTIVQHGDGSYTSNPNKFTFTEEDTKHLVKIHFHPETKINKTFETICKAQTQKIQDAIIDANNMADDTGSYPSIGDALRLKLHAIVEDTVRETILDELISRFPRDRDFLDAQPGMLNAIVHAGADEHPKICYYNSTQKHYDSSRAYSNMVGILGGTRPLESIMRGDRHLGSKADDLTSPYYKISPDHPDTFGPALNDYAVEFTTQLMDNNSHITGEVDHKIMHDNASADVLIGTIKERINLFLERSNEALIRTSISLSPMYGNACVKTFFVPPALRGATLESDMQVAKGSLATTTTFHSDYGPGQKEIYNFIYKFVREGFLASLVITAGLPLLAALSSEV